LDAEIEMLWREEERGRDEGMKPTLRERLKKIQCGVHDGSDSDFFV